MKFLRQPWYRWWWVAIIIVLGIILVNSKVTQLSKRVEVNSPPIQQDSVGESPQLPTLNSPALPLSKETKYGHFPYAEADKSKLIIIASYAEQEYQRFEQLDQEAALALMKMIYAARDEGVWIVPVSGFRDTAHQDLLFKNQVEKRGSIEEAAKVSAPPGYSEHHTGYAIDLADGLFPKKDITYEFEKTKAYQWLTIHAKDFGFELSFPANNPQRISYEPWHWRFIGSPNALSIFRS